MLGTDLGLETPEIMLSGLENIGDEGGGGGGGGEGVGGEGEEAPIYRATKASNEVICAAFKQNYISTLIGS